MLEYIKKVFKEKKVIVVSDNGIKTKDITNFSRFVRLSFYGWVLFSTICFFVNTRIQISKSKKIDELKSLNASLSNNITQMSYFLNDIKGYLYTLNYYDRFDKIDLKKINDMDNNLLKNNFLISINEYNEILPILDDMERDVMNINTLVNTRIEGINGLLKEVSLDKEAENIYKVSYQTNGRYRESDIIYKNSILVNKSGFSALKENISYLNFLESFLNMIPIYKPLDNYYITSRFGTRIDPFTKEAKTHRGLDFAGPFNSVVYAPADGIVEVVAVRGGFGNSIEINHGNGIVTEYAHLNRSLVNAGDAVKRGDKIAIQGSSGRSTGQHLHWEVKVNKQNVDPIKFVRVGEKVY